MGHRVTYWPMPNTQVIMLNGFTIGLGRLLRPSSTARLRQTGKMDAIGRFVPAWLHMLGRRKGPVMVHRVDGVPELVRGHRTAADTVQPGINRLADHTIFQTEYCRTSFVEHCGVTPKSWQVINNAVNPRFFFPAHKSRKPGGVLRLVAVSWSANRRKGFETLAQLSCLSRVEVIFAGNWCPDIEPAEVRVVGVLNSRELADLIRSCDAMVHAAWNEPCSNAIMESMACGLPIVYRDSGGNAELAKDYGVPLGDDLSATLDELMVNYAILRERLRDRREFFLIERAAKEYLAMFRYAVDCGR